MDLFTSYETRRFVYATQGEATIEQEVLGWSQGGCEIVWSDILPRTIALHGCVMLSGADVLELGAGCGLVGLIAA